MKKAVAGGLWWVAIMSGSSAVSAGQLYEGRCHMDECSWFSIEETEGGRLSSDGVLLRITSKFWTSQHPEGSYDKKTPRTGGEAQDWYALCSTSHPAVVFRAGRAWSATTLAPVSDGIFGYNEAAFHMYFAACHQVDTSKEGMIEAYGKKFSYHADPSKIGTFDLVSPNDILRDH